MMNRLQIIKQTFNKVEFMGSDLRQFSVSSALKTNRKLVIDKSRVPVLNEQDLIEEFIKGGGPGGSNVNKTVSCVSLKHVPTGITVKCQFSRLLHQNREIARQIMVERLDNLFNGNMSVQAQKDRFYLKKSSEHDRKSKILKERQSKYKALFNTNSESEENVTS